MVFISHKLAHNPAEEAAIWRWLMVLTILFCWIFWNRRLDISSTMIVLPWNCYPSHVRHDVSRLCCNQMTGRNVE